MCNRATETVKKDTGRKKRSKFLLTPSCIAKKSLLKYVKGNPREEYVQSWPEVNDKHYPKPNTYYAFAEDTNPFTRIENTCTCLGNEFKANFEPPSDPFLLRDPYYEDEATKKYLESEPISFVVFGKPGLNTNELAAMIADGWKCVLISPESLIEREIRKGTEKGAYIEKVLSSGRNPSPEIIEHLIRARLSARDVKHRGYVVEGLPVVPNDPDLDRLYYPKIAELRVQSTTIFLDYSVEGEMPSVCQMIHSPQSSEHDTIPGSSCKVGVDPLDDIPRQVDDIFANWPIKPRIIVYAMCPDEDLLKKQELLIKAEWQMDQSDSSLSMDMGETALPYFTEEDPDDTTAAPSEVPSGCVRGDDRFTRRLVEIRNDAKTRCELYKRLALPIIDKWLLLHNPQNVIRVDGRTTPSQMFEIVSVRLRTLPLQRLLVPRLLIEPVEVGLEGDEDVDRRNQELQKYEGKSNEEAFAELTNKDCVSLRFPWRLSRWRFYCPVELARGRTLEGKPTYSLQFMNYIFFLSSQEAVKSFTDNPRTFLLPPNPRPTCKIAVIGPKYSGKSELSRELAQALDGTLVDVDCLENSLKRDRIDAKVSDAKNRMLDGVINEVRIRLEKERKMKKVLREAELRVWYEEILWTIQRVREIVQTKYLIPPSGDYDDVRQECKVLRQKLRQHNLDHAETDDRLVQQIRKNERILYPYAPDNLRKDEPIRELTAEDPEVSSILQDRVKHIYDEPIELTIDDKVDLIVRHIKSLPTEVLEDGSIRDAGFVLDSMYMDVDVVKSITTQTDIVLEDVAIIFEEDPYVNLIQKWKLLSDDDEEQEEEAEMEEEDVELENYLRHLDDFQTSLTEFRNNLEDFRGNLVLCDLATVSNVSDHVVDQIKGRYRWNARVMTDDEKEQEKTIIEQEWLIESAKQRELFPVHEEDLTGEDELDSLITEAPRKDIRRLGDSSDYCPVALAKYNVLWKGNESFCASFMNNIYLLSSQGALEEFVKNPSEFGIPLSKPRRSIPPLRIGIVGPPGSGKGTLANALSREYGLVWVDYIKCLEAYMTNRGMKAYTLKDQLMEQEETKEEDEEEEEEEVEMPEDLDDVRYGYEEPVVSKFIQSYLQTGGALPKYLLRECFLDLFVAPFDKFGLVLDGFPSCSQDAEMVLEKCKTPEIIIELRCSLERSLERLLAIYLELWQKKQNEDKLAEEARYNKELKSYLYKREKWIQDTIKARYGGSEEGDTRDGDTRDGDERFEGEEGVIYMDDFEFELSPAERTELEEIWREDNPEPVLFEDWEDIEAAKERMTRRLEEAYENEMRKIHSTSSRMEDETVPWMAVDGEQEVRTVMLKVQRNLESYVFRDVQILERTYTIDVETAESLLEHGYYFLSSFGRWCPVQAYQNKIPLQMFLPMEVRDEVRPVIHRRYIYFLCGDEAVSAFEKHPLKYLEQDSCQPLVPMSLSIIGPPKCGKTTLAERFADAYGLRLVSRESALQRVLIDRSWTELAKLIKLSLQDGGTLSDKIVARAVETCLLDPCSSSQGYVFDDFPSHRGETEELTILHIRPMIVIDLKADICFSSECLSYVNRDKNQPANFGIDLLKQRYDRWQQDQSSFREWLNKFSQNIVEIDASCSKWAVWINSDQAVRTKLHNIRRYLREADYEKVHSIQDMRVSPYEFRSRQSIYECYCPVCLLNDQRITSSGGSIDRTGMVHYKEHFYWICSKHRNEFIGSPQQFIPPVNTAILPKIRPRIVDESIDLEHACWARRLQANGFCLVTYVDGLPNRDLVPGKIDLALLYDDKLYLFCSQNCQDQFLCRWLKYCDVRIHFPVNLPAIADLKELPIVGYLEQTIAERVIKAVNQVAVIRPKIPGLTAHVSAAIYMGVHLKVHNVACRVKDNDIYQRVRERIEARRRIVELATKSMKRKLNPYLIIPKNYFIRRNSRLSYQPIKSQTSSIKFRRTSPTQIMNDPDDSSARRVPVPDARFDYLCEYFKPVSKVPAFFNVVDIAGLVKGAAEGHGLGNAFLSHISACDGIFHLCRAFEDDDVTHVEGDVDPVRDLEIISEELRLKDVEFLNGHLEKLEKLVVRGNDKKLKPEYDTLLKVKGVLVEDKKHIRFADWSANDIDVLNKYLFLTSKPVIYLVNLSEKDYIRKKNKWLVKIKEWVDKNDPGAVLIPFSGVFENKVFDMDDGERAKYCEEHKVTSALDKIIVQGYKALQLQYFFTAGHDEVKAWTIQKGTKAPQAAGRIHTDFEKGFIMAEVMKFDDFKNEGSEAAVKAAGKYRQQGRNYVVEDGDIIFFKFNAGAGLKDAKKK